MAIEPVLRFFDFGSPAFVRLVDGFQQRLIEEVAASDLPGLIFTFVWAFDQPGDQRALEQYALPFRERGGRVLYLELKASQEARVQRNMGASRLAGKPSKRDLDGLITVVAAAVVHQFESVRGRLRFERCRSLGSAEAADYG
ncbi:hypothetical protein [Streptomyces jeddahensis]|uniref:Uncharacterized protein n=1 Tax=Streptomyces jeddahensis TaxID=1716141 RepID=A0A177HJM3_9ACTN|nr:hypothetical protein [Streptomyces jeddahensis]OAH10859.1 hypothetical protein STSP_57010 [Streptomyces jeddahensis]